MAELEYFIKIPTWNNGLWEETIFETREKFKSFVLSLFKIPGKYDFHVDEMSLYFNEQAQKFQKLGFFCDSPVNSIDYINYWGSLEDEHFFSEKSKCRNGVIFKGKTNTYYLPRDYYFWINFLPIFDKEKKKYDFPQVWDSQYHASLYDLLAELSYKHSVKLKKRQWGGLQPNSSILLTESGWRSFGELKLKEKIWNPDGTIQTVEEIIDYPNEELYEFEFDDGRKTICGGEHNWYVLDKHSNKKNDWKVLTTNQILKTNLFYITTAPIKTGKKEYKSNRYYIPYIKPTPIKEKTLNIDPYLMGYLLGDGSFKGHGISFTTNDLFVKEEIEKIVGEDYILRDDSNRTNTTARRCRIKYKYKFNNSSNHPTAKYGFHPIIRFIKEYNLFDKNTYTKFIPNIYKESSIEQRIAIIQGMMDSDGYINSSGKDIYYTTVNKILANDFTYIARSLGLNCRIDKKIKQKETHQDFYRIRISGKIDFDLFRLPRKLDRQKLRKNSFENCAIISIKKLDYREDSRCIVVSNPNHLYITNDFIVTHNTYYHCAKLINRFWFEKGQTMKIGASLKDYINEKGAWKFLNEYKNFLNSGKTGWYRESDPDKVLTWMQRQQVRMGDRIYYQGNMSTIIGHSFEKDPTSGVGGNISIFYHEEAGIAPKMDTTYEYIRPALSSGMVTTGIFMASGSVGDLDQCKPLKDMMLDPTGHSMYAVETDLIDNKNTIGFSGLFIPEQWSMQPFINKYGDSLVEEALEAILEERKVWKKTLEASKYQLRISQKPINIHEAFAYRKESIFPLNLVNRQILRIENNEYAIETVELFRNGEGKIEQQSIFKEPINTLGNKVKSIEDKTGVICIHKRPPKEKVWGQFYASIDPVKEGRTESSESLCSIYIYETDSEITKINGQQIENYLQRGGLVAWWCGRYDDLKKTHEQLEMICEYYNAQIICEANVAEFITYMQHRKKQHMLVTRERLLSFTKDQKGESTATQQYGWKNSSPVFQHLLSYGISYLKEELDTIEDNDGKVLKTIYGVERIPDIMLLKEMQEYQGDKGNYDRLVAWLALVTFISIENANRGFRKQVETVTNLEKSNKFSNFIMGGNQNYPQKTNPWAKPTGAFRHIR